MVYSILFVITLKLSTNLVYIIQNRKVFKVFSIYYTNKMIYQKLVSNCNNKLMEKVRKASEIEQRTLSNFIRLACDERANKILKEVQNGK